MAWPQPRALVMAVAWALTCSFPSWAQAQPVPPPGYFQDVHRLGPGLWLLAESGFQVQPVGNVTVIEQSDGLVLVDSGGSPGSGRRIVALIRQLSPKPVKAVLITHWHGDHAQGLSEILQAWPQADTISSLPTQAHLRDPRTMNSPGAPDAVANAAMLKRFQGFAAYARRMCDDAQAPEDRAGWRAAEQLFRQYAQDMDGALTLAPTEGFAAEKLLPDARAPVEIRFLGRGNTDGDAIAWLPKQHVLITGDLVVAPFPFGYGSYPAEWAAVLGQLERYPFRTLVPGHGPPQHDAQYIRRMIAAIREIRQSVASLADQGLTLDEVRDHVDFDDQARRFVGDDPWLRRWFKAYWIESMVASAYKEARGEPIVQSLTGS